MPSTDTIFLLIVQMLIDIPMGTLILKSIIAIYDMLFQTMLSGEFSSEIIALAEYKHLPSFVLYL